MLNAQVNSKGEIMLYAQLNASNAQVQRELLAISRDDMKALAQANKVTMSAVATQVDIINAMIIRMNDALNGTAQNINKVLISDFQSASKVTFLHQIDNLQKQKFDLSNVAEFIKITDKKDSNFCAMYAVEKVFNLLTCLASKNRNALNGYTKAMLVNLLEHGSLTINECKQAVSLEVYAAENRVQLKGAKKIRNLYNSGKSTASTQVSSSRMCLRALNVCNVNKNSSLDEITFNNEAQYTQAVLNLLQMTENTTEQVEQVAAVIEKENAAKKAK